MINEALTYLRTNQQANGSFVGQASKAIWPFSADKQQPTIFHTVLLLDCLSDIDAADDISRKSAEYIKSQKTNQGSWNYWDKHSQNKITEPYPDDLDDTACALAALTRHDSSLVTAHYLGQFARLLIAAEHQAGGPYNTWLADFKVAPKWKHIDVAVNANIGYLLSLHGTHLVELSKYLDAAIISGTYRSAYYVGELPILYFLSRGYQGEQQGILRAKVKSLLNRTSSFTSLEQALLLSTAIRLDIAKSELHDLQKSLVSTFNNGHWPAEVLYVDPVYAGRQYYGGSAVLTTAFALEAMTAFASVQHQTEKVTKTTPRKSSISPLFQKDAARIINDHLKQQYVLAAKSVIDEVNGLEVAEPASLIVQASGWFVPKHMISLLNTASINGWIAYSLYDDMLDGDCSTNVLPVANFAHRLSYDYFTSALRENADYTKLVRNTFDIMDSANDWEQQNAVLQPDDDGLKISKLPNYVDYAQLAERSLGHSLAALGVATNHYGSVDHPSITAIQVFFKHFLIAKQLNDDAHDWEDDLAKGKLSAVVTLLLQKYQPLPCRIHIAAERDNLRQQFWSYTIDEVTALIRQHIIKARNVITEIETTFTSPLFSNWLDKLEVSVDTALSGRDNAVQFMKAYETSYV
ncbi:hypothetical protein BH09PAT3_BH09PAT3_0840 [soil metagenome]